MNHVREEREQQREQQRGQQREHQIQELGEDQQNHRDHQREQQQREHREQQQREQQREQQSLQENVNVKGPMVFNKLNLQHLPTTEERNNIINEQHDPAYSIGSHNSSGFLSDRAPGFGSRNSSGYLSDRMMGIGSRNSSGYLSDRSYESDRELERQCGFFMVMPDDIVNQQQEYIYYNDMGGDRNGPFDLEYFNTVPPLNFSNLHNNMGGEQKPLV